MTYPLPADVILYPSWWSGATTVKIVDTAGGNATFNVGDVQFLSYGVAFPANSVANWAAGVIPWQQIQNVSKVS